MAKAKYIPIDNEPVSTGEIVAIFRSVSDYLHGDYMELEDFKKEFDVETLRTRTHKKNSRAHTKTRTR